MQQIAVFISGTGSNARVLIDYLARSPVGRVRLLVANRADAPGLQMAAERGVETLVLDRREFYDTENLLQELRRRRIEFIALAGFLWLVPPYLVRAYTGRMVNIHPALLPKYGGKGMYGRHVHRAVRAAGEDESGITIHWVTEEYDEGNVILQARTPLAAGDTAEQIGARVLELEHRHYAPVVEQLLQKNIRSKF